MFRKIMLVLVATLLLACLGGTAVSLITNRNFPTEAMDDAQLSWEYPCLR